MATNLEIAGAVKRTQKGDTDWYYGGDNEAWPNLAAAKAGIPSAVRPGKTIGVYISGSIIEYWWPTAAVADGDLVIKESQGTFAALTGDPSDNTALAGALDELQTQVDDRYTKTEIDTTVAGLNQATIFEIYKQQNFY